MTTIIPMDSDLSYPTSLPLTYANSNISVCSTISTLSECSVTSEVADAAMRLHGCLSPLTPTDLPSNLPTDLHSHSPANLPLDHLRDASSNNPAPDSPLVLNENQHQLLIQTHSPITLETLD